MNFSNTSTSNITKVESEGNSLFLKIVSFLGPIIIANGVIGNTAAFLFFRINSDLKKMTCFVYLSFVAITDTLSLFIWNLNHFLGPNFNITIENLSIFTCRLFSFIQFFSLQSGGILLCMVCIDRYVTVSAMPGSFLSKLPFRTIKSAFYWSLLILTLIFILNFHLVILNGLEIEKTVNISTNQTYTTRSFKCYIYSNGFLVFPYWENVNLILKCLVPFIVMIIFNSLLLKIIYSRKSPTEKKYSASNQKSQSKSNQLTFSLIVLSMLYLICVTPSSIIFSYFSTNFNKATLYLIDYPVFFYNANLFAISFFTNIKFRQAAVNTFSCKWKLSSISFVLNLFESLSIIFYFILNYSIWFLTLILTYLIEHLKQNKFFIKRSKFSLYIPSIITKRNWN